MQVEIDWQCVCTLRREAQAWSASHCRSTTATTATMEYHKCAAHCGTFALTVPAAPQNACFSDARIHLCCCTGHQLLAASLAVPNRANLESGLMMNAHDV
jgi:hypothetical protein